MNESYIFPVHSFKNLEAGVFLSFFLTKKKPNYFCLGKMGLWSLEKQGFLQLCKNTAALRQCVESCRRRWNIFSWILKPSFVLCSDNWVWRWEQGTTANHWERAVLQSSNSVCLTGSKIDAKYYKKDTHLYYMMHIGTWFLWMWLITKIYHSFILVLLCLFH